MSDETPSRPEPVRVGGPVCPTCGGPVVARYRPFCSRRCGDVDLHRWLGEVYRVPTNEPDLPPGQEAE
ncbi:DNA gyrase inhibitor YacG [Novispirillum itersonii]|uniref:DNA gyrase inhibitor YacG n=1 Tax=Novispirillum itersonii TaxID=189 RepID=UPI000370C4B4|nr:DNA gyrase inhibitor YacG [Novispirillum itersonii]